MGRKADVRTMKPVVLKQELTIAGMLMKTPYVLSTISVKHDDQNIMMIAVSKQEPWLTQMTTGKAPGQRPLGRSKILEELRRIMFEAKSDVVDSKMCALTFESDDDDEPKNKDKPRTSPKKAKLPEGEIQTLQVPRIPGGGVDVDRISVRVTLIRDRLHVDSSRLDWLLNFIAEEIRTMGVPEVDSGPSRKQGKNIRYNFRDDAYFCEAKGVDGQIYRCSRAVKKRMAGNGKKMNRDHACQIIIEELTAWHDAIMAGELDADASPVGELE